MAGPESRSAAHNACFHALDMHVVRGGGDDPALVHEHDDGTLRSMTFAQLLAEVAALGGVLRAFGVAPDDTVGIDLPESPHAVIAMLACARIGARHVAGDPPGATVVLRHSAGAGTVLAADGQELPWEAALRAGRTDPAAVADVLETGAGSLSTAGSLPFEPLLRGAAIVLRGTGQIER